MSCIFRNGKDMIIPTWYAGNAESQYGNQMILDMSTNASLVTRTFIVLRLRNRMACTILR